MKKIISTIGVAALTAPLFIFAQPEGGTVIEPEQTSLPTGTVDIQELLGKITGWVFTFFLTFAVIFLLLAAFKFLTSGGDESKVKSARGMLVMAIIGIVVALLANFVVPTIVALLGVEMQ